MTENFKSPILMIDGLILNHTKILMVKRDIPPFGGFWVLPGGHVEYGEKVEQAIKREIKEELGIKVAVRELIGFYSDPDRDPRYHAVSLAFYVEHQSGKIILSQEASAYNYFSFEKLPKKIGFDHRKIISDFKNKLNRT